MNRLFIPATLALTLSALNLRAQFLPGPSGMPSSTAHVLAYTWQETTKNFAATNPPTAANEGAPATDVSTQLEGKTVTEHFEAVPARTPNKGLSPKETAARGGAYQTSGTLSDVNAATYNHDGLAFQGLAEKLDTAAKFHAEEISRSYQPLTSNNDDFSFESVVSRYHQNIKSGKWKQFVNGEGCEYRMLFQR
jgi:hypothetical protein